MHCIACIEMLFLHHDCLQYIIMWILLTNITDNSMVDNWFHSRHIFTKVSDQPLWIVGLIDVEIQGLISEKVIIASNRYNRVGKHWNSSLTPTFFWRSQHPGSEINDSRTVQLFTKNAFSIFVASSYSILFMWSCMLYDATASARNTLLQAINK